MPTPAAIQKFETPEIIVCPCSQVVSEATQSAVVLETETEGVVDALAAPTDAVAGVVSCHPPVAVYVQIFPLESTKA